MRLWFCTGWCAMQTSAKYSRLIFVEVLNCNCNCSSWYFLILQEIVEKCDWYDHNRGCTNQLKSLTLWPKWWSQTFLKPLTFSTSQQKFFQGRAAVSMLTKIPRKGAPWWKVYFAVISFEVSKFKLTKGQISSNLKSVYDKMCKHDILRLYSLTWFILWL